VLSNISLWNMNVTDFLIALQKAGHISFTSPLPVISIGMVEVHMKWRALKTYRNGAS